jgi:hypothetical protein
MKKVIKKKEIKRELMEYDPVKNVTKIVPEGTAKVPGRTYTEVDAKAKEKLTVEPSKVVKKHASLKKSSSPESPGEEK